MRFLFVFVISVYCAIACAQKDYSGYYKILSSTVCNDNNADYIKQYKKLDRRYGLLPEEIYSFSNTSFISGNVRLASKFLLHAADCGLDLTNASQLTYADSLFLIVPNLRNKYLWRYNRFYRKKCDNIAVNEIGKIYAYDQSIRSINRQFFQLDTVYQRKFKRIFDAQDSLDYSNLYRIITTVNFDPSRLTIEAKRGMYIILLHCSTTPSTQSDSVFKIIWKMVLKGAFPPYKYAEAYDRYYHVKYSMNYYCEFYIKTMPIYEPENIDKRRADIYLYPLWKSYQQQGILNNLPKDYKYDINSVKQK